MLFTESEFVRFKLSEGDILLNEGQSLELCGRPAIYKGEPADCCYQNTLVRFRPNPETDTKYAFSLFLFFLDTGVFASISSQTTSIAHLGVSRFAGLRGPFPPLSEQCQIAEILESWDRAIDALQKLLTAKTTRLRSLRNQLLTGAKRFPEFQKQGVWPRTLLEKAAEEMNVRNKGNVPDHKLFAVTKAEGLVPMKDRVKGISTQRCMVVEQDWYAYNPMRINIGSIARHYSPEAVMVSPDYVVFRAKPAVLLPDYLDHLRRSQLWSDFVSNAGSGSVRVRIYFDALGLLSFPLPTIAEQTRIATFLNACQREIDLLATQLEALKQQKRGMMQKLLTGEIRTNS